MKNFGAFGATLLVLVLLQSSGGGQGVVQARAVNISNTWTLPQDGFGVFYRYFRDKISWFEADAVCQFHHANLVTVDNGVQFDSARAFLKELDVTNPVWIGLMRPESSGRFTWTNAKSLDPTNGYWAEELPAMESPLCAVLDPIRDFRWHALRCGGPETAAFLCELPVPNWATDCTITSLPSLTVQYLSDSGAVQLSRDCGEQGTRHMSCQGKLDRDAIMQQLQCSDEEEDPLGAQTAQTENNQLPAEGTAAVVVTRKPQQPVLPSQILEHDILTVVSSNDEDNNIDINPNQIEDTVKNVINKFNLADLIQSEQGLHSDEIGEAEKESKKALGSKKYSLLYEKKDKFGKKGSKLDEDEEMMQGDQPDETETQPIDIVQQAVKPTEGESDESATAGGSTEGIVTSSEISIIESTTEDSRLRRATDSEVTSQVVLSSTTERSTTEFSSTTESATSSTTSSHILPTTPKKEILSTGDHFIPPMLMVKARFIATKPHSEVTSSSTTELVTETFEAPNVSSESSTPEVEISVSTEHATDHNDIGASESNVKVSTTEGISSTDKPDSTTSHQIVEITFDDKDMTSKIGTLSITTRPFTAEESSPSTEGVESTPLVQNLTTAEQPTSVSTNAPITETSTVAESTTTTPSTTTTTTPVPTTINLPTTTTPQPTTTKKPLPTPAVQQRFELHHEEHDPENTEHDHESSTSSEETEEGDEHHQELHNSFSNIENYQPYKPNRHRSLTKPEVHNNRGNYIKKILG